MVRTVVVNFIAQLLHWNAILAFLVWFVLTFAFGFKFIKEMLEALML